MFLVGPDHSVFTQEQETPKDIVFATLQLDDYQLMLQTRDSLIQDTKEAVLTPEPLMTGTIYIRDHSVESVLNRAQDYLIKDPVEQWYGMREIYLKDPDGYVVCIGEKI